MSIKYTMLRKAKHVDYGYPDAGSLLAAIKDNVISAADELYIAKRQPQDAAQCLIDVTIGSNMGVPHLQHFPCFAPSCASPSVGSVGTPLQRVWFLGTLCCCMLS